ncbi:kinase-like domain-containing protein [Desarmillaria tabescens]|uniref:non-specific serine/threonine protein kinase n=1 Tax=Armillaria tabescens TaxID=1929756 RepID=A0AA39NDI5_ARMTA|nr:kinase-like domain-containing protein [Desarmillaria tabescens]KAK0463637.1 kinase-like domain-containing protein [Desarmillaria tabescens]
MAPARTTKRKAPSEPHSETARKRIRTEVQSSRLVNVRGALDNFLHFYSDKPEYKSVPPPSLRIPKSRRPDPLYVDHCLYIKTIGQGSTCTVGVVESMRDEHPLDKPATLFAVKIVRKVVMRVNEDDLDAQPPKGDHHNVKNTERTCLGTLPWNAFVAGMISTDSDNFNFYTLLEYFSGGSLQNILDGHGAQSPRQARFYIACIALGVDFLHRNGVLHCDIKPDNILMCTSGYPVLADFGNIRDVDALKKDQREWFVLGTSAWMCPEIHKESKTPPPKCSPTMIDWWALGCILFSLIGGRSPFIASGDQHDGPVIARVVNRDFVQPIDSLPAGPNCKDLISRFLRADPYARIGANGHGLQEIKLHPWMQNIIWHKVFAREYLAPLMMTAVPETKQPHLYPLPRQIRVPDMEVWTPPVHLAYMPPKAKKTPV